MVNNKKKKIKIIIEQIKQELVILNKDNELGLLQLEKIKMDLEYLKLLLLNE